MQFDHGTQHSLLVPPGDYQIATEQIAYQGQRVVWPQKIQVQAGKQFTAKFDSGVRLSGPGSSGSSEFELKDSQGNTFQSWKGNVAQLIPPGTYSLVARPNSSSDWRSIKDAVVVKPGSFTDIPVPALY
jgi:hypothetical protein